MLLKTNKVGNGLICALFPHAKCGVYRRRSILYAIKKVVVILQIDRDIYYFKVSLFVWFPALFGVYFVRVRFKYGYFSSSYTEIPVGRV